MSDCPIYDETVAALAKQARSRSRNPARWSYFELAILAAIVAVGVALWLLAGMR